MFVVCGEALFDVFAAGDPPSGLALDGRIGGSPFNVALGLARLAQPVAFFGGISHGFLGARLMRALSNLVDNAIHYNRPGGTVRIAVVVSGRHVRIDITDTGAGIPPGDLVRVFERFYRVDKSRTRDSGGTGLGLAIAKHAIESQGGTISVSSRAGAGSTFTIQLPVY